MPKIVLDIILVVLFGKESLDGYYTSPKKTERKNYIFSSVFPNRAIMELALEDRNAIPSTHD